MFFLKKRNLLFYSFLLLTASLLLTGCGPGSSTSQKNQEPSTAATQPVLESVAKTSGPVPQTLWDKRAEYEKEGQVVLFTDCGLYKGDTDELTGAKCEFRQGRWVLLEPKLEPGDNLIKNGDFSEWNKDMTHPLGYTCDRIADATYTLRPENKDFISPPFALKFQAARIVDSVTRPLVQLNVNFADGNIKKINNQELFLMGNFKLLSKNSNSIFSIAFLTFFNNVWSTSMIYKIDEKEHDRWIQIKEKYIIRKDADKCFLRLMFHDPGSILIDDLAIYRGILPMF